MIGQGNRTVWGVFVDGFICVHLGLSSRQGSLTVNLDLISVSKVCLGLCGVCVCNLSGVYIEFTLILLMGE